MTNYISLPHLVQNNKLNSILINYSKNHSDKKRFNFEIESLNGSLPYTIWNGDVNSNCGDLILINGIFNMVNRAPAVIRYDFSNILLENNDFLDVHGNAILEASNNGCTQIEISNLNLLNYIQNKYDNYSFIFSKNADLINQFTPEIINTINSQEIFDLISLPVYYNNNTEFLSNIVKKDKIELTVGRKCKCDPNRIKQCILSEHRDQLEFSDYSRFSDCAIENKYKNYNEIKDEIETLNKLGFNHFKIDTPGVVDLNIFNLYLIFSLFETECAFEILREWRK